MRIYIAGPMSKYPQFNFPAFYKVAARLRAGGHMVFNPAEKDVEVYGPAFHDAVLTSMDGNPEDLKPFNFSKRRALGIDLAWICQHGDAVVLLPGWKKKRSSRVEHALAEALDLTIVEAPKAWLE